LRTGELLREAATLTRKRRAWDDCAQSVFTRKERIAMKSAKKSFDAFDALAYT
jgi:hypothetical protein